MSGRDTEVMGTSAVLIVTHVAAAWHPVILLNMLRLVYVIT